MVTTSETLALVQFVDMSTYCVTSGDKLTHNNFNELNLIGVFRHEQLVRDTAI